MCQIPSSPLLYKEAERPREDPTWSSYQQPRILGSLRGLIWELINEEPWSWAETGYWKKDPKRGSLERNTSLSPNGHTQDSWFWWEIIQKRVVLTNETLPCIFNKRKKVAGSDVFPISLSYVSVQIMKIMQITILAPLLEENIIKLCSKYFVCFSNYSHVTVNINSCYSV